MPTNILLCAPPGDRRPQIARIAAALSRHFGPAHLHWPDAGAAAEDVAAHSDVLVVPILLDDGAGVRDSLFGRADDAWLRAVLVAAHARRRLIVPLLLDGKAMPPASRFPAELGFLTEQQAVVIGAESFARDMRRAIRQIDTQRHGFRPVLLVAAGLLVAVAWGVGLALLAGAAVPGASFARMHSLVLAAQHIFPTRDPVLVVFVILAIPFFAIWLVMLGQAIRERRWRWAAMLVITAGASGALLLATSGTGSFARAPNVLTVALSLAAAAAALCLLVYAATVTRLPLYLELRSRRPANASGVSSKEAIFDFFLSYRRSDAAAMGSRMYTYLHRAINRGLRTGAVFRDVEEMIAGDDFVAILDQAVGASQTMLVLIGPTWVTVTDAAGHRRLDDPADFVRHEIAEALRRGVLVVPLLLESAHLPVAGDLPPDLRPLASLTALPVRSGRRFGADLRQVQRFVDRALGVRTHPVLAATVWLPTLIELAAAAYFLTHHALMMAFGEHALPALCASAAAPRPCPGGYAAPDVRAMQMFAVLFLCAALGVAATTAISAVRAGAHRWVAGMLLLAALWPPAVAALAALLAAPTDLLPLLVVVALVVETLLLIQTGAIGSYTLRDRRILHHQEKPAVGGREEPAPMGEPSAHHAAASTFSPRGRQASRRQP